ncbi:alpha/beta fold hydrolase [Dongia sp.]|uniref:alpha/beta fold hydrolase n=1 Tax=Dongia sp. TaxID=1977262 RepID=UPI0035B2BFED
MSGLRNSLAAAMATAAMASAALPAAAEQVQYQSIKVDGLDIFYREAGPKDAPTVLLLHGFPTSSHMFRELIPILAGKYHVVAPDYPGFGYSSAPSPDQFQYTFAHLADVVDDFTKGLGLDSYVVYMQDYGGPVGMRLALKNPEKVRGFIVQNAVTNVEGWNPDVVASFAPAWQNRSPETEKPLRAAFSAEATKFQYTHSGARAQNVSPDTWTFDQALLDRPGNDRIQVELLYQYQDNVAQYPAWQDFLKKTQPPMLVVWGNNDPFFTLAGRDYFKTLVPSAEMHDYDAGHFALETHLPEISSAILSFLGRLPGRS